MGIYVPDTRLMLEAMLDYRSKSHPELERRLRRAVENTGQVSFAFPEPWEDTASIAANAAADVLDRQDLDKANYRYIAVGSETAIDHAKPVASYVQGMLKRGGYKLNPMMTTFEMKHACAGGTTSLLATAALLGFSGVPEDKALVICSDMARYDAPSTAEITQGAGAVAMVVEQNPRLLELDMDRHGYFASDVDDFFRPLGSVTAKVKGRFSMECYQEALESAFSDYCARRGGSPCDLIDEVDYIALHVPFVKMPEGAVRRMLKKPCGKSPEQIEAFLEKTAFLESMDLNRRLGNLYTGSLYAYLINLLNLQYRKIGEKIVGKTILIASYGSGNTMMVFTAKVSEGAPEVIASWDPEVTEKNARTAGFQEYLNWLGRPKDLDAWRNLLEGVKAPEGRFHLKDFGETGLRIYGRG